MGCFGATGSVMAPATGMATFRRAGAAVSCPVAPALARELEERGAAGHGPLQARSLRCGARRDWMEASDEDVVVGRWSLVAMNWWLVVGYVRRMRTYLGFWSESEWLIVNIEQAPIRLEGEGGMVTICFGDKGFCCPLNSTCARSNVPSSVRQGGDQSFRRWERGAQKAAIVLRRA